MCRLASLGLSPQCRHCALAHFVGVREPGNHVQQNKKDARLLQDSNLRANFAPHFECGSLTTRTNSRKIEHILNSTNCSI